MKVGSLVNSSVFISIIGTSDKHRAWISAQNYDVPSIDSIYAAA